MNDAITYLDQRLEQLPGCDDYDAPEFQAGLERLSQELAQAAAVVLYAHSTGRDEQLVKFQTALLATWERLRNDFLKEVENHVNTPIAQQPPEPEPAPTAAPTEQLPLLTTDEAKWPLTRAEIYKHRRRLGWTQRRLATELEVSASHISYIESGKAETTLCQRRYMYELFALPKPAKDDA